MNFYCEREIFKMASLSKYYNDILVSNGLNCTQVIHPNLKCSQLLLQNVPYMVLGTSQFFFPLYFLPLLANPRNVTRKKFLEICRIFINSVQTAFLTAFTILGLICQFHKIRGKVTYWYLLPIPSIIGGWSIFFATDKVRTLFGHTAATIIFEILIRNGTFLPLKMIQRSNALRTLLFMSLSGIILDTLYVTKGSMFWLVQPLKSGKTPNIGDLEEHDGISLIKKIVSADKHVCNHKGGCDSHVINVLKNYLAIGLALEAVKVIFTNLSTMAKNPKVGFVNAFKGINLKCLFFITGYPTLYRLTNCLFNRWFQKPSRLNHSIAAFIGGLPFYLYANQLSILSHTMATAIELSWMRYLKQGNSDSKIHKYASRIPFANLVYILGGGLMYNVRVFYPWLAPKFLIRLVELLTNHKFDEICQRLHTYWIPGTLV